MNIVKSLILMSAAMIALSGCGASDESTPDGTDGEVSVYEAAVDLEIGSRDGAGADVFGRVSGLVEDVDGRIYIGDIQANEVRVFSLAGEHLYSFGEPGAGPGELNRPCCFALAPDGKFWIRDNGNRRYNGYVIEDASLRFEEQRQMVHRSGGYWTRLTFREDGALVDVGSSPEHPGEFVTARFFVTEDGTLDASESAPIIPPEERGMTVVPRTVEGMTMRVVVNQPFGPRQILGHGPMGRWSHVLTSSYDVTSHTPSDTVQLTRDVEGPPLSPDELERAEDGLQRDLDRAGVGPGDLPFGIPERHTPVRWLYYDAHGHLWVERNMPDTESREADIWTDDGSRIAEIHWPRDVELRIPGWIGETSALGVRRDSLGVETVVRLTFEDHGG